jgi:hypothetical protein
MLPLCNPACASRLCLAVCRRRWGRGARGGAFGRHRPRRPRPPDAARGVADANRGRGAVRPVSGLTGCWVVGWQMLWGGESSGPAAGMLGHPSKDGRSAANSAALIVFTGYIRRQSVLCPFSFPARSCTLCQLSFSTAPDRWQACLGRDPEPYQPIGAHGVRRQALGLPYSVSGRWRVPLNWV